jgi:hypothetical protein
MRLLRAWLEPTQPRPIDALLFESLPQILVSFLLCYALDALVLKLGLGKSRWFTLHTIVNAFVCILAAEDTYTTLVDPIHALEGPVSTLAISLIIALHAYHSVIRHVRPSACLIATCDPGPRPTPHVRVAAGVRHARCRSHVTLARAPRPTLRVAAGVLHAQCR